jgi:hypothetical protein
MGSLERLLTGGIGLNLSLWAPMVSVFVTSSLRARPSRSSSPHNLALCRSCHRSLYMRGRRHDGIDWGCKGTKEEKFLTGWGTAVVQDLSIHFAGSHQWQWATFYGLLGEDSETLQRPFTNRLWAATKQIVGDERMWLAREPGAGSGKRGAGKKRAGSRDCRKKSRNR